MSESTMTIDEDGNKFWKNSSGKFHRTGDPAIEWSNGGKEWWENGKLHRTDGPAVEWADGYKEWWINGKCHRTDGPAVEYANGNKVWYLNGNPLGYDEKGFWKLWDTLTEEEKKDPTLLSYLLGNLNV